MRRGILLTGAVVAVASGVALWRAAATAGDAVRPVAPATPVLERGFPVAAEAALGRRVLVLFVDPAKPRVGQILESGRAPEGWALFPGAPPGADAYAAALDALAARAAASFDGERGFPADVEQALALFAVKSVLVDDGGKGATPLRTLDLAEPVLRLDGGASEVAGGRDPVALAAALRTSVARESAGWTTSDWDDAMWGGAVTVDTTAPARFVFPYPAAGARVEVNGAEATSLPASSQAAPLLVLDLPAGRSRIDVRFLAPGPGETLALAGAAGLVVSLLAMVLALRPSRGDVEAAAARDGASGT